jgi:peptidoglycan/LPS O-acetylase OafA/YrhL
LPLRSFCSSAHQQTTIVTAAVSAKRIHALDGLRAVAVLLVLVHHAGASAAANALHARGLEIPANFAYSATASGVELFFVLSGVALLRPYLRSCRHLDVKQYALRRMQRLWPPFFVAWLISGVVIALGTRFPTWWWQEPLPHFNWSSWVAQVGIVYFGYEPYNFAWWSLTVEIFFYVLAPLIVPAVIFCRMNLRWMVAALLVSCVVASTAPFLEHQMPEPLRRFLAYSPCFVAGVMLARHDLPKQLAAAFIAVGVAFCVMACALPLLNVHIGYALLYTGLVSFAIGQRNWLSNALSRWHLVWLGERSYSLFVVHFAVFTLVGLLVSMNIQSKGAAYFLITRAIQIPAALLVAMLIFHFLERHFARGLVTADSFWPLKSQPKSTDPESVLAADSLLH